MPEDPNANPEFTLDDGDYFDFDLNQANEHEEVDDEL